MAPINTQNRAAVAENDTDADFPGVRALLHFDQGQLRLALGNQAKEALSRVRVTYRLPLRQGENRLFLLCWKWPPCFLRLVKPGTSERLKEIRFEIPPPAK